MAGAILGLLVFGSSLELALATNITKLPKETLDYFANPNNLNSDQVRLCFLFLPLVCTMKEVWRSLSARGERAGRGGLGNETLDYFTNQNNLNVSGAPKTVT